MTSLNIQPAGMNNRIAFLSSRILALLRLQSKVDEIAINHGQDYSRRTASGSYDVLAIVDQTHLPGVIKDKSTGVTLGWCVTIQASVHDTI
jgi:hypothetical protein